MKSILQWASLFANFCEFQQTKWVNEKQLNVNYKNERKANAWGGSTQPNQG